ncbi:MAG TPA: protein kinase [Gemmatales bacterium]|nr:protein kinase [Gemmatales bacterium]
MLVLIKGTQVQKYCILQRISAGGMGEVFLAEDTKLKRRVALKFPLAGMDATVYRRFMREAEAVARLNHPNVVTIHEVGECQDRPFLVMEHIEGESLRSLCQRERLGVARILTLMADICAGLAAAHEKGIIHRDIKPGNIVIDHRGTPKLLDFGMATLAGVEPLSRPGSLVGTIRYMSPEQVRGEPADQRSDLFALGVMLYELLCGRPPFDGPTEAATLHAILSHTPPSIIESRADVPNTVEGMVFRLLERDPARRFQSVVELRDALLQVMTHDQQTASAVTSPMKSILVLPFENLSGDRDDVYFSNGLSEEIITDLAKIEGIEVISRKSSMLLAGTQKDIPTLGREFAVQYVLSGSVRRAQQSIRVNVELVEARHDRQQWAERYSGTLEDVFEIQEKIARAIAQALKVRLSTSAINALARRSIRNTQAHDLFLRARQESTRWTRDGLDQAHRFLEEALRLEPESAVLHAALGNSYYNYVNLGFHQEESISLALASVEKARALEPDSLDALRMLGVIQCSLLGQAQEGLRHLLQVLQASPQDTEAMQWVIITAGFRGKPDLGVQWAKRLVRAEPFIALNEVYLACAHFFRGDFAKSHELAKVVFDREPANALVQFMMTLILLYRGQYEEARTCAALIESRQALGILDRLVVALVSAQQGRRDKVQAMLTEECKTSARRDLQYPWHIGTALAMLGEYEEAMQWIELAVENGFANHRFLEEFDPFLDPLRKDARFEKVVAIARDEAMTA